jgi:hypothetical protein
VKTTLEIPDALFRKAKATAAEKGLTLKQLITAALEQKLNSTKSGAKKKEPEWMKYFGAFGKTAAMRAETRRIQRLIDEAFEQIEPEDRA